MSLPLKTLRLKPQCFETEIDAVLVSAVAKAEVLLLIDSIDMDADADSPFEINLQKAADYIRDNGSRKRGCKGSVVAKEIGVTNATFRRHYVAPLKARFGMENERKGYFIPVPEWNVSGDF
jgi:hypothetical protein